MRMILAMGLVLASLSINPVEATKEAHAADIETLHVRVVGVHDGDTLTALTADKRQLKVRLHGIDAPELGQPFGQASKRALSDLVFGKQVTLHTTGTDRYGRTLARVTVGDIEVDAQMIATGHAWHYSRYDHTAALEAAERKARAARRGLWAHRVPCRYGIGREKREPRPHGLIEPNGSEPFRVSGALSQAHSRSAMQHGGNNLLPELLYRRNGSRMILPRAWILCS